MLGHYLVGRLALHERIPISAADVAYVILVTCRVLGTLKKTRWASAAASLRASLASELVWPRTWGQQIATRGSR